MKRLVIVLVFFILIGGIVLTAYAPDTLSTIFIVVMEVLLILGSAIGLLPVVLYYTGFQNGCRNIDRLMEVNTNSLWSAMVAQEEVFRQRTLDRLFLDYQEKVIMQQRLGQTMSDIEDYINEEVLAIYSWQSVITQIPSTLTGLGVLGTFVGLLVGIRGISFSTVNAALSSVQTLLSGIQVAFYTSIAGVILSLLFNIVYRITWNMMLRNLAMFTEEFHKHVIPPVEEQDRYRENRGLKQITELLERIPKNANYGAAVSSSLSPKGGNEQILMPQILSGLRTREFVFYLQPRYDLNSREIIGSEAVVRWNHGKLGVVSPRVFVPVLESNGYITKLDRYIWEEVCSTLRNWIDSGRRPVPIAINVTKTEIHAMDVADFFEEMLKKYHLSPRNIEIEIAQNAYLESPSAVIDTEMRLREMGLRVVVDDFDGDFISISTIDHFAADALKLDLRSFNGSNNPAAITALFEQARKLQFHLYVDGIESLEQLSLLRRCGCTEGQGDPLSKPVPLTEYEKIMDGDAIL